MVRVFFYFFEKKKHKSQQNIPIWYVRTVAGSAWWRLKIGRWPRHEGHFFHFKKTKKMRHPARHLHNQNPEGVFGLAKFCKT
jgi:hypothetical protein